jgi:hypothetical protein
MLSLKLSGRFLSSINKKCIRLINNKCDATCKQQQKPPSIDKPSNTTYYSFPNNSLSNNNGDKWTWFYKYDPNQLTKRAEYFNDLYANQYTIKKKINHGI